MGMRRSTVRCNVEQDQIFIFFFFFFIFEKIRGYLLPAILRAHRKVGCATLFRDRKKISIRFEVRLASTSNFHTVVE